jgi:GTP-binding protein
MDARHPMTPLDVQLLDWFSVTGKPVHVLLTKADKLPKSKAARHLAEVVSILDKEYPGYTVQLFSSTSKLGLKEADGAINEWFQTWVNVGR